MKLTRQTVGGHGGEGNHAEGVQEHKIVNQLIQQKMETIVD